MQYTVPSPFHQPEGFPVSTSETNADRNDNVINMETAKRTATLSRNVEILKTYTVEEAIESIGLGFFQLKIFLVGHLIMAADAMEVMLLAVLSPLVRCEWQLESVYVAFITSAFFIGMGISAPFSGIVGDIYGRKIILIIVSIGIGYFGFLASFTPSYGWFVFLRFLVGFGMGGSSHGFALNAEYLPSKHRAKILIIGKRFFTLGTLFEIILAMTIVPVLGWRWLIALSAVPILVAGISLLWIPESARFLVVAGCLKHANRILEDAAKTNNKSLPEGILVQSKEVARGRVKDLFSHEYLRSSLQLWILWFGATFSYYGLVLASAEILLVGNAENKSTCNCTYLGTDDYIAMFLSTLGELLSVPICWVLLDRFGRRVTGGVCFWGITIFVLTLLLDVSLYVLNFFMFCVRAFGTSTFTLAYIYTTELYPTSVRTLGFGLCLAFGRIGAIMTPFVAQVLLSSSIATATWVYAIVAFLCGMCAFLLPIETLGRSLPQAVKNERDN